MNFKHIPNGHLELTEELKAHAEDKIHHVDHLLLKESDCTVHYSSRRFEFCVDVMIANSFGHFKAQARAESFEMALDEVVHKLSGQLVKHKNRVQEHKVYDRSKQGRMQRLSPELEYDNRPYPGKKPA